MNTAIKISSFFTIALLLSAWSLTTPLEWFYHNRSKFVLLSEDEESQRTFLCVKGKTEDETEKRVNEANAYYSKETDKIVQKYVEKTMKDLFKSDDNGDGKAAFIMSQISDNLLLQKEITELIDIVEESYQCKLIDINDVEVETSHE